MRSLVLVLAAAGILLGCGTTTNPSSAPARPTVTTRSLPAKAAPPTQTLTVPTRTWNPRIPTPATTPVHGRGRLLSPRILVFHVPGGVADYYNSSYYAGFRTADTFSRSDESDPDHRLPGSIWVGDSFDDFEGFGGAGAGRPRGRCYLWGVAATPLLKGKREGDPVRVTLKLNHTTGVQRGTARLRIVHSLHDPAVRRAYTGIGCPDENY
jgi:hypothetical protein